MTHRIHQVFCLLKLEILRGPHEHCVSLCELMSSNGMGSMSLVLAFIGKYPPEQFDWTAWFYLKNEFLAALPSIGFSLSLLEWLLQLRSLDTTISWTALDNQCQL